MDIQVETDNQDIHPTKICTKCQYFNKQLIKCQRRKERLAQLKIKLAEEIIKYEFKNHTDDNCELCLGMSLEENTRSQETQQSPQPSQSTMQQKPSPFVYSVQASEDSPSSAQSIQPRNLFPETSPLLVTKTPKRKDRGPSREILIGTDPRSIVNSQFLDPDLAEKYKCSICSIDTISRIPLKPLTTVFCHHFYCPLCIKNWMSSDLVSSSSCPVTSCRKTFADTDLHSPSGLIKTVHQGLSVHCLFLKNGCDQILNLGSYLDHIQTCEYARNRGHPTKQPIGTLTRSDGRKRRLDPLRDNFLESCAKQKEDPADAVCGLLFSLTSGSRMIQDQVRNIWNKLIGKDDSENKESENIDEEDIAKMGRRGLLYKGELLLSANDYKNAIRFQKNFFGTKLPSYELIQKALAQSLPSNSNYHLESDQNLREILSCFQDPERILKNQPSDDLEIKREREKSLFHHSTDNYDSMDPCSIQLNFLDSSYSMIMVTGRVLYNLLNLDKIRNFSGEATVNLVMFRDGTDKIETMNIVSDRLLPVAGWKTCMAITRIEETGTGRLLFMRREPCSQYHVQPLGAAFLDENDIGSLVALSRPFEEEARVLRASTMTVTSKSGLSRSFRFKVRSVPDKKVGTKDVGCTIAGSKFICQKGSATSETAKKNPQTCVLDKTLENASFWALMWTWNPEKLDAKDLYDKSTGLYNHPITSAQPSDRPVDILHQTKINFWEKIKKLLVNLLVFQKNPGLKRTWEMRGFSPEYKNEEKKLNSHLSSKLGITPKMTQNPGNDANKALDAENREILLHLLDSESADRRNLADALKLMDKARKMFDYIPKLDDLGEVIGEVPEKSMYDEVILEYHRKFFSSFPWANCSSGQHDITDHIGDDIGSICEMSAQGIESQHHLWRYFLTNTSFKGDPQRRLDDSLENQYILTDDEVVGELSVLPSQVQHCSNCLESGHNIKTCSSHCGQCGSYLHKSNNCTSVAFTSDLILHSTL